MREVQLMFFLWLSGCIAAFYHGGAAEGVLVSIATLYWTWSVTEHVETYGEDAEMERELLED